MASAIFLPSKAGAVGEPTFTGGSNVSGAPNTPLDINDLQVSGTSDTVVNVRLEVPSGEMSLTPAVDVTRVIDSVTVQQLQGPINRMNETLATLQYQNSSLGSNNIKAYLLGEGEYYNSTNGHVYKFANTNVNFAVALTESAGQPQIGGVGGYLVTITSQQENDFIKNFLNYTTWIASSDGTTEGDWYWMAGPENGQQFWQGGPKSSGGHAINNAYNYWDGGEPNNSASAEDCGTISYDASYTYNGLWNDVGCNESIGYIAEFGTPGNLPQVQSKTVTANITNASTFNISSCEDLNTIAADPSLYQYYTLNLADNINCDGVSFSGMFSEATPFKGTFDGNNKNISNIVLYNIGNGNSGLFNSTYNATIKNLTINGESAFSADYCVGSLVGFAKNATSIQNVTSYASVDGTYDVGGIVGCNENTNGTSEISSTEYAGNMTHGSSNGGGIVGRTNVAGGIAKTNYESNIFSGDLATAGNENVAGLYGSINIEGNSNNSVTVNNNQSIGTISPISPSTYINVTGLGGVVGYIRSMLGSNPNGNVVITNNTNSSELTTNSWVVGGIIGYFYNYRGSKAIVSSNESTGAVTSSNSNRSGGIIGTMENGDAASQFEVLNNTVTGIVTAQAGFAGGVVGSIGYEWGTYQSSTNIGMNSVLNNVASINSGESSVGGGIVGFANMSAYASINIYRNNFEGLLTDNNTNLIYMGGIIGFQELYGESSSNIYQNIVDTYHEDNISVKGGYASGGILGYSYSYDSSQSNIYQNAVASDVYGSGSSIGGIIGELEVNGLSKNPEMNIENNYMAGNVSWYGNAIGGIVGSIDISNGHGSESSTSTINIRKNYSSGSVSTDGNYAGGLIGSLPAVDNTTTIINLDNSFATASISATGGLVGGLVGINNASGSEDSASTIGLYYDIYGTGQSECNTGPALANCTGVNYGNSQPNYFQSNTVNAPLNTWDFSSVWGTSPAINGGLPCLQWENPLCNPAGDADGDGISNAVENAGPNSGDANNDGVADYLQGRISTLVDSVSTKYQVVQTDCVENGSVGSSAESGTNIDRGFDYPAGLTSFTTRCPYSGYTANVTLYYYGSYNPSDFVLRKYNPSTGAYTTLTNATFSTQTIGGQSVLLAQYSITDGGEFDQDGVANGIIVDPVGIAKTATISPNTGFGRI